VPLALRTGRTTAPDQPPPIDETDLDRIVRLIPIEVLTVYAAVVAVAAPPAPFALAWFVIALALVAVVLWLDGRATGARAGRGQYLVRTATFVAWAAVLDRTSVTIEVRRLAAIAVVVIPLAGGIVIRPRAGPDP
jgi:hypothetical protein